MSEGRPRLLWGHFYRARLRQLTPMELATHKLLLAQEKLVRAVTPKRIAEPSLAKTEYKAPKRAHGHCERCTRPIHGYHGMCRECYQNAAQEKYDKRRKQDAERVELARKLLGDQ